MTEKDAFRSPARWLFRGYLPSKGSLDGKANASDLCETFTLGSVGNGGKRRPHDRSLALADDMSPAEAGHFYASNIWPDQPADFRYRIEELYLVLDSVSSQVARLSTGHPSLSPAG